MFSKKIIIPLVFVVAFAAVAFSAYQSHNNIPANQNTIFPVYPNPEPLPSPAPAPSPKSVGYISGHVTIGPNCPVERIDQPCPPSPEAYTSREAVVYAGDGATVVKRIHLDVKGNYKVAVTPGNYFVQIQPAGIRAGDKKYVTVKSGENVTVDFDIDTGIR
jgi:hypothetical protein